MREFKCNRCGVCCKHVADVEEAEFLDRGDGVCKYYDDNLKNAQSMTLDQIYVELIKCIKDINQK